MTTNDHHASGTLTNPAADAAAMLLRLGFAIFALVIPSATLMSRWVIVVLVPIGAVLIILSSLLRADSARLSDRALSRLASGPGLACLLLVSWALVSLLWTPVRGEAVEKLFKLLGVVSLGFFAVIALPQRMRATNLHLITIGVALGATLILVGSVSALLGQPVLRFPLATPERVVILLTVLGWIGAAWLLIKNRRSMAFALMVLVIAAIALGPNRAAFGSLAASLLVLALAWNRPEVAGRIMGLAVGAVILLLPLASAFGSVLGLPGLERWWQLILNEPLRFLTGRGFDAGNAARVIGAIGPELPVSLISELWFDLGVLGALFFAIAVAWAFIAAGKLGYELAPATLAALSAAMTVALFDRNATQTWWFNGLAVFAIVLMSVERGRYRTVRPRAEIKP
ncbi:MAG: hypothetical protein IOC64_04320 [Methylobacterium sp.]|nr:hypothetical protein [Methylobacterium sp.]MCA3600309.1 hypothetical protein [Methylobacterium sp.]MCA3605605.1 hypothetical protein [Methylobacterium sp.]MCA3608061.1 hypothetical protein [Methylobacterium sp.]MCA3613523.1 hypothetical protein [Methylobacterium sp.]